MPQRARCLRRQGRGWGSCPFTGGGGADGDTIALLLGNQPDLTRAFTVVPRADGVDAIVREHRFQRSGLTDSDTITQLGRQMNVDYVVAGHIHLDIFTLNA